MTEFIIPALKPHQVSGAAWLAKKRHALLADEMRVGKTLTALEAARHIEAEDILVVCPAVARFNWARNIQEHLGRRPQIALRRSEPRLGSIVVTSYDLAAQVADEYWDLVILDESHYLRRCEAGRTKIILGKGGLIHRATFAWFLSGTPAVNHYGELWQMLYVCGLYAGTYEDFLREFCVVFQGPYGTQIRGSKNHEKLKELMAGFMLRRKFAEIAPELPPIELSDYTIELPREAGPLDCPALRDALNAPDPMAALEMQAPAVATLRRYTGLAKVGQVAYLVRAELDENMDKIVLFTYHREVLEGLKRALMGFSPVSVAGGDTPRQREQALRTFKDDPRCRVFIGQILAAGTAIDLSVASNALFVESSWVPGENAQAAMRLQNINQDRRVTVRFVGMAGSLDEQIQRVVRRKTRDFSNLFG
jgi:SNF2 family DNA or RNA helicase